MKQKIITDVIHIDHDEVDEASFASMARDDVFHLNDKAFGTIK
jgi:hypothetical protein